MKIRDACVMAAAALVVALPFLLRRPMDASRWSPGDPIVVVVSPHNEAIRYEFGRAFSDWHAAHYGRPAKVDWRVIGGTSEIMRYLESESVTALRAWWKAQGRSWPTGGGEAALDRRAWPERPPPEVAADPAASARWQVCAAVRRAFRETDAAGAFSCRIDILFGGGVYDHDKAYRQGLTVPAWPLGREPPGLLVAADGTALIPERVGGEVWRGPGFFGAALSTFGICYNRDRLADLGIATPPVRWRDLAAPAYFRQLGVGDPTKSGSLAKAFEMMIHAECHAAVAAAGFGAAEATAYEQAIDAAGWQAALPAGVPPGYQAAVAAGWRAGLQLAQRIGANARYFTDGAGKIPIDVSSGNAAAGLAIDFYGRYQAELSRGVDGHSPMVYVTPAAGSSVSADPISLLRGAVHRDMALRFITFVLSEDGQRLWNYRPGTSGGPVKFALRRLPIRRDFYPSATNALLQAASERHGANCVDPLSDPAVNPYAVGAQFTYHPRWTARHFNVHRDLIRAMCLDAAEELQSAWAAIIAAGGPAAQPAAMALLQRLPDKPEPMTWESSLTIGRRYERLDYMREWTTYFRASYREALAAVRRDDRSARAEGRRQP
jgi:iron(III) transport system substrate-binding protein